MSRANAAEMRDDPRMAAFRQPPMELQAEQAVIGAVFAFPDVLDDLRFLLPEHFASEPYGRVWEIILALAEGGRIPDPINVNQTARTDPVLIDAGGQDLIAQLASAAVGRINAGEYARLIVDMFERRRILEIADAAVNRVFQGVVAGSAREVMASVEEAFAEFETTGLEGPRPMSDAMDCAVADIERAWRGDGPVGLQTGLIDLDALIGGLFAPDLTVIGGATSMGKTALANSIVAAVAATGTPCLVFSLEMGAEQLAMREVAARTGLPVPAMRGGRLTEQDMTDVITASRDSRGLPIWIDDRPSIGLPMIGATAKRLIRKEGIGLVVVDYLQLVQPPDRYGGNRTQEVSEIARGLKNMAKILKVPVIALSQLSRASATRENKRPILSDFRESGEIEQAADNMWGVYREAYYLKQAEPRRQERESAEDFTLRLDEWLSRMEAVKFDAEVMVLKQRQGDIGKVNLFFDGPRMRFGNRARRDDGDDF